MTTGFSPESMISVSAEDSSSSGPYVQEGKKPKHDGACFNASAVVEKLLTQDVYMTQSTKDSVAPVMFRLHQDEAPLSDDEILEAEADAEACQLSASLLLFDANREEESARE